MNTHDIDIELPPLPEARIVSYQTDSTMRRMELRTYSDKDMKDYARAAIEADRKRRGEPVAYASEMGEAAEAYYNQFKYAHKLPAQFRWSEVWEVMNNAAPQPAESCASLISDKPVCGSENGDCDSQPAEPVKDSVDVDDLIAVCIARGDMTKDAFLEARQWVRDTYYNPAEPVKVNVIFETRGGVVTGTTDAKVKRVAWQDDGSLTVVIDYWPQPAEPVKVPSEDGGET